MFLRNGQKLTGVSARNIIKRYGRAIVLDNVSFEISEGEFAAVLGPSGCGKSTLLRIIAGLEEFQGEISIAGKPVNEIPPGRRDVAMVFQNYALYPHMSVYQNMAFGLKNAGLAKEEIERRLRSAIDLLQLQDVTQCKPGELSGGQQQRVALGRAIVKKPKVFMFDEPLANLDAFLRVKMRREIAAIHRRERATTILVTHDQTEAMALADRIIVMSKAHIEQIGTPREIYECPATTFVATFVGLPSMNLIAADSAWGVTLLQQVRCKPGVLLTAIPSTGEYFGRVDRIGIRPEGINIVAPECADLKAEVISTEFYGDSVHVMMALSSGETVTATVRSKIAIRLGEIVSLTLDINQIHLFDTQGSNMNSQLFNREPCRETGSTV